MCQKRKLTLAAAKKAVITCKERKSGEERYYKCWECGHYHLTSWETYYGNPDPKNVKAQLKVKGKYKREKINYNKLL